MKTINIKVLAITITLVLSCIIIGCQKEEFEEIQQQEFLGEYSSDLAITDFKNWLKSQDITHEYIREQTPNWSNVEFKVLPDGNSSQVSIEMYKGKNSLGNDSIIELQVAHVKNSFTGGVKVFSFYNKENAYVKYYDLSGQILEEGEYYKPNQQYILLKRHTFEEFRIRLKSSPEVSNSCDGTLLYTNSTTPLKINGVTNRNAYNCHAYVWGTLSANNPCYMSAMPYWNNCPNISGSGYSLVSGSPRVGDRWVSYGHVSGWGYVAVHSAIVMEVKNGRVTKLKAKCGADGIYIYNPSCSNFSSYMTSDVRYYRK